MRASVATGASPDLDLASASQVTVLITARDRTVRERCARLIHDTSSRHGGPFAVMRCGRRGRPSEGVRNIPALEAALAVTRGGTLFVDDIGDLPPPVQRRLLTATASRDVRIIAGTNHSLLTDVGAGTFDETLFYRLNVLHLMPRPDGAGTAA